MKPCLIRKVKFYDTVLVERGPDLRHTHLFPKGAEVKLDWWDETRQRYVHHAIQVSEERGLQFADELRA